MHKQKLVTVGKESHLVAISETDGKWHAHASPQPPSDGQLYILPQWHCDAVSKRELHEKLDQHFRDIFDSQQRNFKKIVPVVECA